jgi:hypothetical protein
MACFKQFGEILIALPSVHRNLSERALGPRGLVLSGIKARRIAMQVRSLGVSNGIPPPRPAVYFSLDDYLSIRDTIKPVS